MKTQTYRKIFLLFYHLLILVLSWIFTIKYEPQIAHALNIGFLGIGGPVAAFMPRVIAILQTIIFLAATIDAFTTLNLWWSKRYSDLKTRSGEFFAWFSTLKSGPKKHDLFAVWQTKLYSIFLMINTFFLALIFALIFSSTEFAVVFYIAIGLLAICFIAIILSIRLFLNWMEAPLKDGELVVD